MYGEIVGSRRFWRFANEENCSLARSAFYRFVKNSCINSQDLVKTHMALVKEEFLGKAFQERNSGCVSYLWDALLVLTKTFPDVWVAGDVKKSPISKFLGFLRNGSFGSPQESYPCILPFISLLPSSFISSEFCKSFFETFWEGSNHIDRFASVLFCKSYFECCVYLLKT